MLGQFGAPQQHPVKAARLLLPRSSNNVCKHRIGGSLHALVQRGHPMNAQIWSARA